MNSISRFLPAVLIGLAVAAVGLVIGLSVGTRHAATPAADDPVTTSPQTTVAATVTTTSDRSIPAWATVIKQGDIAWTAPTPATTAPVAINMDYYTDTSMTVDENGKEVPSETNGQRFADVVFSTIGTVTAGDAAGSTLYLMTETPTAAFEGTPAVSRRTFIILAKGDIQRVLLLARRLPEGTVADDSAERDPYRVAATQATIDWVTEKAADGAVSVGRLPIGSATILDTTTAIEDLWLPLRIAGAIGGHTVTFDAQNQVYAYGTAPAALPAGAQPVVTTAYGPVYRTPSADTFTIPLADSTAAVYEYDVMSALFAPNTADATYAAGGMEIPVMKGSTTEGRLRVTWTDGTADTSAFYKVRPSGCTGQTLMIVDPKDEAALMTTIATIGTDTQGGAVYGPASVTTPAFAAFYDAMYYVPEGQKKMTPTELLAIRPIVYWRDPFGRLLQFVRADLMAPAECGKPVIYLYPTTTTDVTVHVAPTGGFTVTDPDYGTGWHVSATPGSVLTDLATGKTYPYLFWEGHGTVPAPRDLGGFVVARADLESFFDRTLAQQGLSAKEITDFVEFWAPRMRQDDAPYFRVTYLPRATIDANAPLSVDPRPDTVIRVLMDYVPLDAPVDVAPQHLTAPARRGFTVVEWGGVLHN